MSNVYALSVSITESKTDAISAETPILDNEFDEDFYMLDGSSNHDEVEDLVF